MFAALKEKLKGAIKKFSRDVEEKSEVIKAPETVPDAEHKPFLEKKTSEHKEVNKEEVKEEKVGFFGKLKSVFSGKPKEEEIKETVHEAERVHEIETVQEEERKYEKEELTQKKQELRQEKEESKEEKKTPHHEKKIMPSSEEEVLEEYITDMEEKPTYGVEIGEKSIDEKKFEEKTLEEKETEETKIEEKKPEATKKVEIPLTHHPEPHIETHIETKKEAEKEPEKTPEKKDESKLEKKHEPKPEKRYEFPYKIETSWAEKKKELDIKIERRRREIAEAQRLKTAEAQKKEEFDKKAELANKSELESNRRLELEPGKKQELKGKDELEQEEPTSQKELKVTIEHEAPVVQKIENILEEKLHPSIQKTETKGIKTEPTEEKEQEQEQEKEEKAEPKEEKKSAWGIFTKITDLVTKTVLSEGKFEEIFWEMEIVLLENNLAVEVIEKIKQDLRKQIVGKPIKRGKVEEVIIEAIGNSIDDLFSVEKIDLIDKIKEKRKRGEPFVIAFVGVNGSGKTTTIAKMAKLFLNNRLKPVIAASDTFRAAAIQQLEAHAVKLGVKLIKQDYGSDPAAVAYDAIKFALQKGMDVVMIDTAGRLHSNVNLMDEMKKIIRVAKPDMKIFIGEAITGNDCVEQARQFNEAVGIDGIILCKADVDDKGGAAISVSYVTGKPILYLGTGQGYDDLKEFDKNIVLKSLDLSEAVE
ncbi:signal recognition particle-docking protein FtsY [Candidatus Woesearchaeota archaeon]|nr:signal recognition particle-docking protein FtsY [Candidatus Woesearchaeota archaeon]